jgi:integrase
LKSVDTKIEWAYAWPTMPTLWRRPSNGCYYVVFQENGHSRKKSLKTREHRTAVKLFNAFRQDLIRKKVAPIGGRLSVTLSMFRDELLAHVETSLSLSTYECYKTALDKALQCWGDIPVGHITSRHIDKYTQDLIRSGLKIPTVNKNRRHLKGALNKAYEWEYLKAPVRFSSPVKEDESVRYLTNKELSKILSHIHDPEFNDLVLLAAYTGLRSGEILRLTWNDIDNPQGFLRISPRQKNRKEAWIPINKTTRAVIGRCRSRRDQDAGLFRFQTRQTISKTFKRAARAAGIPHARFHDLRHTFGSHLAMAGQNEVTIKELMRHKSIASTMVYTHVSPRHLAAASAKINYGPMPIPMQKSGQKQDRGR